MSDRAGCTVEEISLPQLSASRVRDQRSSRQRPESRRLIDSHGRTITDLRLSITDRCNFRCVYCMDPDVRFAPRDELLSVPELLTVARACVALGVTRIRLTGGEPTLHPQLLEIMRGVTALGIQDLSLTTNGSLVTPEVLDTWRDAGLRRLTFSLDAITPAAFTAMTRSTGSADGVVAAIRAAINAGLTPVKVNAVVMRGRNEDEIAPLARLARELGFEMRYIEYMPLDSGRRWEPHMLVPADEILARAAEAGALVPLGRDASNSTSETFVFRDDLDGGAAARGAHGRPRNTAPSARIGVIAPVTRPFCGACSRLRITADGRVRPCLFSLQEFDLRAALRDRALAARGTAAHQRVIEDLVLDAVWSKQAGHGITSADFRQPERPMSAIGG